MTIPDTLPSIITSIHISSVSFRLFMSCPQNRKEGKGETSFGKIKRKEQYRKRGGGGYC